MRRGSSVKCGPYSWKQDEKFMRLVLRVLLPGETVLIEANDEYGVYGEDDAGLPVPWVGR